MKVALPETQPTKLELNPYGFGGNNKPILANSPEEAALIRAKEKLAAIRQGDARDKRLGASKLFLIILGLVLVVYVPSQVYNGLRLHDYNSEPLTDLSLSSLTATTPIATSMLYVVMLVWAALSSIPNTPKRAARRFYRSICWSVFPNARRLVVATDLDDSQRTAPTLPNLSEPLSSPVRFSSGSGFVDYWKSVVGMTRKKRRMNKVKYTLLNEYADDLVLAKLEITFWRGGTIISSKFPPQEVQKLLVKVGKEWKLFNGEWQGYEETNLSWLE